METPEEGWEINWAQIQALVQEAIDATCKQVGCTPSQISGESIVIRFTEDHVQIEITPQDSPFHQPQNTVNNDRN